MGISIYNYRAGQISVKRCQLCGVLGPDYTMHVIRPGQASDITARSTKRSVLICGTCLLKLRRATGEEKRAFDVAVELLAQEKNT